MSARRVAARAAAGAALAALALASSGCGGERSYDAEELVREANEHGAGLVLGEQLGDEVNEVVTYALRFAAGGDRETPAEDHGHGGGSLAITESAEAGRAEYERCESAVTLLCFRAANAVIAFEGDYTEEDVERVSDAFRGLAGGD